jgi:hypothetical protein
MTIAIDVGRIRFVWQGNWSAATTYAKDDVVYHNGNAYVCIVASSVNQDPTTATSQWEKMVQGSDLGAISGLAANDLIYYDGSNFQRLGVGNQGDALVIGANGLEWGKAKGVQQVQFVTDESTTGGSSYAAATEHELPWSVTLTASVDAPYFEVYSRCNVDDSSSTSFGADLGLKWAVVATAPNVNVYTKIKAPQQHTQYHSGSSDTYLQLHMTNYFQLSNVTAGQQLVFQPLIRSHNVAFRLFNNGNGHTPTRGGETIVKEYFF